MKRILLLTTMVALSFYASSQVIEKEDKLLGSDLSFYIYNSDNNGIDHKRNSNAGIFPSFGIALKDDLVLGPRGSITYNRTAATYTDSLKTTETSLGVGLGVFLKKYKLVQNKFGVYFDNELGSNWDYRKHNSTGSQPGFDSKFWRVYYHFNPGVFYKFSDRFLGEANIGGVYASYSKTDYYTSHVSLGVSFFQYFNLGLSYRLSKKKTEG